MMAQMNNIDRAAATIHHTEVMSPVPDLKIKMKPLQFTASPNLVNYS
jgi:hypothetical protein